MNEEQVLIEQQAAQLISAQDEILTALNKHCPGDYLAAINAIALVLHSLLEGRSSPQEIDFNEKLKHFGAVVITLKTADTSGQIIANLGVKNGAH